MQKNQISMKHLISFFTTLVFMFGCNSANAEDFSANGINYNITDSVKLTVEVTYQGSLYENFSYYYTGDVEIPETVTYNNKNYSVTSIGRSAFHGSRELTSVTIPNSITSIGDRAFTDCTRLTSVNIPNSITKIGSSVFDNTPWFNNQPDGLVYAGKVAYKYKGTMPENTSIEITEGTLAIAVTAFSQCNNLTSVIIPNSVIHIGSDAFERCNSLTSITIPNSVTSIGQFAFSGCKGLTTVTLSNSADIDYAVFSGCINLTSIIIPHGVKDIGSSAFEQCSNLTSISIPNSVTKIGSNTFNGCNSLTSITIPNSVSRIGTGAFAGCGGLERIKVLAEVPPITYDKTFSNYEIELYVPQQAVSAYQATSPWNKFTNIVGIESADTKKALVEGRTWNYKQTTFDIKANDIVEKFFSLTIKGETTFRDVHCREIYHTENGKSSLYGYAYEDGAKVYFYFLKDIENLCSPSTDWELIFDFDKEETEIINASFPAYLVAKDTIEVKGNTYQRYWIGPKLEPKFKSEIIKFYPIVHSIGGYAGLHNNTFERTGKSPSYSCESVYDGDECIFEKKDFCADAINSEYDKYLKGKRWNYSHSSYMKVFGDNKKNFSLRRHHPYSLAINGDTVVAGRSCKKIYYINKYTEYSFQLNEVLSDTLFVPNNDVVLHGYIHETKDSVSFYIEKEIFGVDSPEANGKWCKMYDFTAPSGTYCDWLEELSEPGFYMLGKEDVVIGGQTYTAYLLYGDKMSSLQGTIAVIPGIGCDGLFFSTPRFGTSTFSLYFSSVYDGDNCLWNSKNQNELFDKYFGKYAAVRLGSEPMESQFDYNHNHVTHLWVWGKPQAADYEYLRDNRLAGLSYLNLRNADIDTIPSKAFYTTISNKKRIILPATLKHLDDSALCVTYPQYSAPGEYELTFELSCPTYPTLGKDVYVEKKDFYDLAAMPIIVPSADNKAFRCNSNNADGILYSEDGTTAYYSNGNSIIAEGTRIINGAFMENGFFVNKITLPATLDSIGDRAFANVIYLEDTGYYVETMTCYAPNPPKLGKDVFLNSVIYHIPVYVPSRSYDIYKTTEVWKDFDLRKLVDDAIEDITTGKQSSSDIFDLQGRKVKTPTKGLYIKEGKKVVVK